MPELPEVETTKEGIKNYLEGQIIQSVLVRNCNLRQPVPENLNELCLSKKIIAVSRRAKYLIIQLSQGYLLIHLGMSGHLRLVPSQTLLKKHDHISLFLDSEKALRFHDPRRFGLFLYLEQDPLQHPLMCRLGPEPLSELFNGNYLYQQTITKQKPIKSMIMDNAVVVGIGNIYATESLFLAGIHPNRPSKSLNAEECRRLVAQIKKVLKQAIAQGGTTLRDFYTSEGKPGYFNTLLQVYGRQNLPCLSCNYLICTLVIGGRNSAFCPHCQQ